jgi:hypothetical protein
VPPSWLDPFCAVSVQAVPWNLAGNAPAPQAAADGLAIVIFSQAAAKLDVHVTLIGSVYAYDAFLKGATLSGSPPGLRSPTYVVRLGKPDSIRYAYIDSYAAKGAAATTCPSEPLEIHTWQDSVWHPVPPGAHATAFPAVYLQTLPAPTCGQIFRYPSVTRASQPPPQRVDAPRSSEIVAFVNASGDVVKTYVYRSSGVDYLDTAAALAAQRSSYAPGQLLCVPVVGSFVFRVDFKP